MQTLIIIMFVIHEVYLKIASFYIDEELVAEIYCCIIPMIIAIINILLIKKNKPKVIQLISYIIIIIVSICFCCLKEYIGLRILLIAWNIIPIIMQFIYIKLQEKDIIESKPRKIANIIMYYVIQMVVVIGIIGLMGLFIVTFGVDKYYVSMHKKAISELASQITLWQDAQISDVYIPVENNDKYGFIDENGQEKIKVEYDIVSNFNEIQINYMTYYVALAKKDNVYYLISKNNDKIRIENKLETWLKYYDEFGITTYDMYGYGFFAPVSRFYMVYTPILGIHLACNQQEVDKNDRYYVEWGEEDTEFSYEAQDYIMKIEPINNESNEEQYKVTTYRDNEKVESSIVSLPGMYVSRYSKRANLDLSFGEYVEFKDEKNSQFGFYDEKGNKIIVSDLYDKERINKIEYIKEDKIVLSLKDDGTHQINRFVIIDKKGNILLETAVFEAFKNGCVLRNQNNKMVLTDSNFNAISNEYDKIIASFGVEVLSLIAEYLTLIND